MKKADQEAVDEQGRIVPTSRERRQYGHERGDEHRNAEHVLAAETHRQPAARKLKKLKKIRYSVYMYIATIIKKPILGKLNSRRSTMPTQVLGCFSSTQIVRPIFIHSFIYYF